MMRVRDLQDGDLFVHRGRVYRATDRWHEPPTEKMRICICTDGSTDQLDPSGIVTVVRDARKKGRNDEQEE